MKRARIFRNPYHPPPLGVPDRRDAAAEWAGGGPQRRDPDHDLWDGEVDLAALKGAGQTEATTSGAALLMSHNPDPLPEVPASAGLTVCGYTHGGQIRLPLIGAISTASKYGERFAQG